MRRTALLCATWGAVAACGDGKPRVPAPDLAVIQGRDVRKATSGPTTLVEARERARQALLVAVPISWRQDPPDNQRSFTWDVALQTGALAAVADIDGAARGVTALLARQLSDGAWPIMVSNKTGESNLAPGASETLAALAVLGALIDTPLVPNHKPAIENALARGVSWLQGRWLASGGVSIASGSTRSSTESTAVAVLAALSLGGRCAWCADRQTAALQLLTTVLWRGDHFARGADGAQIDDDQTGPHTHQALALLALIAARNDNAGAPDPAAFNPLPWLTPRFTHQQEVMGRPVARLGDRMAMVDGDGRLYGCDGGQVALVNGQPRLVCAPGTVRVANPGTGCGCSDPYGSCAAVADAIPAGATVVPTVNSEITLLAASAALAAHDDARAAALLNAGLAMQTVHGGVIAIAGPLAAPNYPVGYPQNQRTVQFGYTALLLAALVRRMPLAPFTDLAPKLPDAVALSSAAPVQALPVAFVPDPCTSSVASLGNGDFMLAGQMRSDGWLGWNTVTRHDIWAPAACYSLSYGLSGSGPWTGHEVKIVDARGTTHGLRYPKGLGPDPIYRKLSLSWLGLFWPRDFDDVSVPFELSQLELVAWGDPHEPISGLVEMQVKGLRIDPGDCLEGSPGSMVAERVSVEGAGDRFPQISALPDEPGIAIELDDAAWQRIVIQDRWSWPCASNVVLRFRPLHPMRLQVIVEDSNSNSSFTTGARSFFEKLVDKSTAWQDMEIPIEMFTRFEPNDPRTLDWSRIRKIAVAFPGPSSSQQIDVQSIVARAPGERLDATGACR